MEIEYCANCVTPNTRPRIEFDEEGVCNACRWAEEKAKMDWAAKWQELKELTDGYRNPDGYDCIIPVSGGKDSHAQVYYLKEKLGLNPLCVTFTPSLPNDVGQKNLRNMIEKLGVDHISITPDPHVHAELCKIMFLEHGNIFIPWEYGIFSAVSQIAIEKKIPLIIYGESGEKEYGGQTEGDQLSNENIHKRVKTGNVASPEEWTKYGFTKNQLLPYILPSVEDLNAAGVKRIYLGDYVNWQPNRHLYIAMNVIGGFTLLDEPITASYVRGASIDDDIDEVYMFFLWVKACPLP